MEELQCRTRLLWKRIWTQATPTHTGAGQTPPAQDRQQGKPDASLGRAALAALQVSRVWGVQTRKAGK